MPNIVSTKAMDVTRILSEGYANIGKARANAILGLAGSFSQTMSNLTNIYSSNRAYYSSIVESLKTPEGVNVVSNANILGVLEDTKRRLAQIYKKSKGWLSYEDKVLMSQLKNNAENEVAKHKTISKFIMDAIEKIQENKSDFDEDYFNKMLEFYAKEKDVPGIDPDGLGNPFLRIKRYDNVESFIGDFITEHKSEMMKLYKPSDIAGGVAGDNYIIKEKQEYGNFNEAVDFLASKIIEDRKAFYTIKDEMQKEGYDIKDKNSISQYLTDKYKDYITTNIKPSYRQKMRQAYNTGSGYEKQSIFDTQYSVNEVTNKKEQTIVYRPGSVKFNLIKDIEPIDLSSTSKQVWGDYEVFIPSQKGAEVVATFPGVSIVRLNGFYIKGTPFGNTSIKDNPVKRFEKLDPKFKDAIAKALNKDKDDLTYEDFRTAIEKGVIQLSKDGLYVNKPLEVYVENSDIVSAIRPYYSKTFGQDRLKEIEQRNKNQ